MVRPTSEAQYASAEAQVLPEPDEVREGVWSLPQLLGVPGPPHSFSYVVLDSGGGVHIIDPGSALEGNWERLTRLLALLGRSVGDVASVTVTHLHSDHLGHAERIRDESGASVAMLAQEQSAIDHLASLGPSIPDYEAWGMPTEVAAELGSLLSQRRFPAFRSDVQLHHGTDLDIPGRRIRVLHTPGHTPGHLCLWAMDEDLLFTGDALLPKIFPGIGLGGPSDGAIGDFLSSLVTFEIIGDPEVCPGHGYRFRGLAERCRETREHHLRRAREVAAVLRDRRAAPVWEVARELTWTDGWSGLTRSNLASALTQTALYMEFTSAKLLGPADAG